MEKGFEAGAGHNRSGCAGSEGSLITEDRKSDGLRLAVRAAGSILLPRQRETGNRPGGVNKDGTYTTSVRDTVPAAAIP